MWNKDKYGNAMRIAFTMKFRRGKEIIARIAIKLKSMMKFRWERDKYSTPLNIQNPSVESLVLGREKCRCQIISLCWQEQKYVTSLLINMTCIKRFRNSVTSSLFV